eukprot:m.325839 g.325839  ORF g.325839 m.325839 type:complete len:182 (+) comp27656_c0_seq1:48-593(+)
MSSNLSLTVVPNHLSQNTEQTCTSNTAHRTQAARDHPPGTHPDVQCGMNETLVYRLSTCARELLFCDATVPSWFPAPRADRNRGLYSTAAVYCAEMADEFVVEDTLAAGAAAAGWDSHCSPGSVPCGPRPTTAVRVMASPASKPPSSGTITNIAVMIIPSLTAGLMYDAQGHGASSVRGLR